VFSGILADKQWVSVKSRCDGLQILFYFLPQLWQDHVWKACGRAISRRFDAKGAIQWILQ
jgi:hypothetical protein